MKSKYLLFLIPIGILFIFYLQTTKPNIQGNFVRTFIKDTSFHQRMTLNIKGIVDGICIDNEDLWINRKFSIVKYNKDSSKEVMLKTTIPVSSNAPIQEFYVENDSVYFSQPNKPQIHFIDLKNNNKEQTYQVDFPFSYFHKSINQSVIFQETVVGKASAQIHFLNLNTTQQNINNTALSSEIGSSMRYSGSFIASKNKSYIFFIPFYEDYIYCFDSTGNLRYKLKGIDHLDHELKIIKENNLFYLSPHSIMLRYSSAVYKNRLYLSSNVRCKNQSLQTAKENLTLDVYNVKNGHYLHSIALPNFHGADPGAFAINTNNILFAKYGNKIITYNISKEVNHE